APIRFCSRWGLPCRARCRARGALLPHRFTLASVGRSLSGRSLLCGTFPGVTPAGHYPAPYVHGARTFLPGGLSALAGAAVRPTDAQGMGCAGRGVKGEARAYSMPAAANACLASALPRKARNAFAAWGEGAPVINAAP